MKVFLFLTLLFTCNSNIKSQGRPQASQLNKLDPSDSIDKMILRQNSRLDTLVFGTNIWLTKTVATQYDPLFGVIINKEDLLKVIKKNGILDLESFFRLVIAHEKMHARQLVSLARVNRRYEDLSAEEKQLFECQADMCAGYVFLYPNIKMYSSILTRSYLQEYRVQNNISNDKGPFFDLNPSDSTLLFADLKRNSEAINTFLSIGEEEGLFGGHPEPIQRKNAFYLGNQAFFLNSLEIPMSSEIKQSISAAEWEYLTNRYKYVQWMLGVLPMDYQYNGFFENWSNRISNKVIHFIDGASRNVVFKILNTKWDTRIENPYYSFNFEIVNNNSDSILVDVDVPINLVDRKDPRNPIKSKLVTNWHGFYKIAPRESKLIKDSTLWSPGTDSTMPNVTLPGEEGSFYSVFPITKDPLRYVNRSKSDTTLRFNSEKDLEFSSIKMANFLYRISSNLNSMETEKLRAGAGIVYAGEKHVRYRFWQNGVKFNLLEPTSATENPFLTAIVVSFTSFEKAKEAIISIVEEVKQIDSDFKVSDESAEEKTPFYYIKNQTGQELFSISLLKERGKYQVYVELSKVEN